MFYATQSPLPITWRAPLLIALTAAGASEGGNDAKRIEGIDEPPNTKADPGRDPIFPTPS
jgi:hypothetical protein